MRKYEWRDGQIWDTERACWITWETITGKTFIADDMRVQIIDLLNDGTKLYTVLSAARKLIASAEVGNGYHAYVQTYKELVTAVKAVDKEYGG